jgi:hypothetical protein
MIVILSEEFGLWFMRILINPRGVRSELEKLYDYEDVGKRARPSKFQYVLRKRCGGRT